VLLVAGAAGVAVAQLGAIRVAAWISLGCSAGAIAATVGALSIPPRR
jgi:hypothetical protein